MSSVLRVSLQDAKEWLGAKPSAGIWCRATGNRSPRSGRCQLGSVTTSSRYGHRQYLDIHVLFKEELS